MDLKDYKQLFKNEVDISLLSKIHAGKHTDFKAKYVAFLQLRKLSK